MSVWNSVRLIHWPRQGTQREWCRRHSIPRILVVEPGHTPPRVVDIYEDWVRTPTSEDDLRVRARVLAQRRLEFDRPVMEEGRELVVRRQRVRLSPSQAAIADLLTDAFGDVVLRGELARALYRHTGSGSSRNVLDLHVGRLRRKVEPLGLTIRTVWGCGYALQARDSAPPSPGGSSMLRVELDPAPVA